MRIAMHYMNHGFFVHNPRQIAADLDDMAAMGCRDVVYSLLEQDDFFCPRTVEAHFDRARRAGLKVHVIPGRHGGLFAGAPKVPSLYAAAHPEFCVRREDGGVYGSDIGVFLCPSHPETFAFLTESITRLVERYGVDGIVYDEPKTPFVPCWCGRCRAERGDRTPEAHRRDALIEFMARVTAQVAARHPGVEQTLFIDGSYGDDLARGWAEQCTLAAFGTDGPVTGHRVREPDDLICKTALLERAPSILQMARETGKRSYLLVENFLVHRKDFDRLEAEVYAVADLGPDAMGFYYYGSNNDDPETLMEIVRRLVRTIRCW